MEQIYGVGQTHGPPGWTCSGSAGRPDRTVGGGTQTRIRRRLPLPHRVEVLWERDWSPLCGASCTPLVPF